MGPLRGVKRDTWEGGHRVAFIARWPNVIAANSTSNELVSHVDLMATVASILNVKLPDSAGVDSVNILPALKGEKLTQPIREAMVHHSGSGDLAIRQGDWVFIDAKSGNANGARAQSDWFNKQRGYVDDNYPGQLFNITEDISERKNYYAIHPEIVSRLKSLLEKYKRDGRSTPGVPQKNDNTKNSGDAFAWVPNETTP
jgi:arylsulfatase A-like enzyme